MQLVDEATLTEAVHYLCQKDERLASVVDQYGKPPLWSRDEGFATLIHIILEQQVSLSSAKAAFDKLLQKLGDIRPDLFLQLSDEELKSVGFSRQKSRYGRELAQAILDGSLDLDSLQTLPDKEVSKQITGIKGIGPWTANIYLLMALRRPDIWPDGDLALELAIQYLYIRKKRPTVKSARKMSTRWKPWRSVAARILYHYYLSR